LANFDILRKSRNLAWAALSGDEGKVRELHLAGLNVNASYRIPIGHERFSRARLTPLEAAIEGGDLHTVKLLVSCGAKINNIKGTSSLPLFRCARLNRLELAEFLLRHGADVNAEQSSTTAFKVAASCGYQQMMLLLLRYGANVNAQLESTSALEAAVSRGADGMVELLLSHGANVYMESERSRLLDNAVSGGHTGAIMLISRYSVDPWKEAGHKTRFKIIALRNDVEEIQSYMPHHIRNPEIDDFGGLLQYAACHGRKEVVEMLLDRGADVNLRSGALGRPLAWSISQSHRHIVKLLLDWDAEVNNWTGLFSSALECATVYGRKEIASLLLDYGADIDALENNVRARCVAMLKDPMWSRSS
jgi:cytohesin